MRKWTQTKFEDVNYGGLSSHGQKKGDTIQLNNANGSCSLQIRPENILGMMTYVHRIYDEFIRCIKSWSHRTYNTTLSVDYILLSYLGYGLRVCVTHCNNEYS